MQPTRFRTAFNYNTDEASLASSLSCPPGSSLTHVEFQQETDINYIAQQFGLTGLLPNAFPSLNYADFSEVYDYKTALDSIHNAHDQFMALPSAIRSRFNNNPQELLVFLEDTANREEAVKLGLVNPSPPLSNPPQSPQEPLQGSKTATPVGG
ncbi:MAG: internal scaffolding protein [Microvirus sp.]|nr:MAG: internal scaffolding protein [Microvirus sp.]